MIAAEKTNYPVAVMCRVLGVSRTGFHNWERRAPSDRALTDAWLTEKIKQIHENSRGVYGVPRVHAELRMEHDVRVGRKRVARLMKAAGIAGVRPRKRWRTTIRIPGITPASDLVERQFKPVAPNVLWVADITYLRTGEGWLYLAAVQDAYSRQIVGWSMATHMRASLVVDALKMALARRRPDPGLIHHSDQGSQGGFKWSSQRLIERGCDGRAEASVDRALRPAMWSPGRPTAGRREDRVVFWLAVGDGMASVEAAKLAGVSEAVGVRWFREGGGMPTVTLAPLSGRYLSFAEREEIALLRAQKLGVREIARRVGRSPSTISRELRRNAGTRSGSLTYRGRAVARRPACPTTEASEARCRSAAAPLRAGSSLGCCAAAQRHTRRRTDGRVGWASSRTAQGPALGEVVEP